MTCSYKEKASVRGFTLLETLVAITILTIAIVGPLTIASRGLTTALVASDQITATYLTQDAIEYIRFARDSNILSCTGNTCAVTWLTYGGSSGVNLTQCLRVASTDQNQCYFDTTQNVTPPTACSASGCPALNYNTSNEIYNYNAPSSTNVPTKFTRSVSIRVVNNIEAIVSATTTWQEGSLTHNVALHDDLFEWQL